MKTFSFLVSASISQSATKKKPSFLFYREGHKTYSWWERTCDSFYLFMVYYIILASGISTEVFFRRYALGNNSNIPKKLNILAFGWRTDEKKTTKLLLSWWTYLSAIRNIFHLRLDAWRQKAVINILSFRWVTLILTSSSFIFHLSVTRSYLFQLRPSFSLSCDVFFR